MQRLRTRPQFQAVLASKLGVRTVHFALHCCDLQQINCPPTASTSAGIQSGTPSAIDAANQAVIGAMVPKRLAKRAVTRNAIKRQIFSVSTQFKAHLAPRAHVVRLRAAFDRKVFTSASSAALKAAVRTELLALFTSACAHPQLRA